MSPGKAYTDHQFHSNSYTGPRPTPTIPKGGLFSIYASTPIPTSPLHPYNALVDVRQWHEWNTYMPAVLITKHPRPHSRSLRLEVGTNMTLTYQLTPTERSESKEVVRHLEALKMRALDNSATGKYVTRIRWTMDNAGLLAPGFMLKTERVCEIEELDDGTSIFRTWQTFAGLGARLVQRKWEKVLQERYLDLVRDVRRRSLILEKRHVAAARGKAEEEERKEHVGVDEQVHGDRPAAATATVGALA